MEPRIQWFFDSLKAQDPLDQVRVIVIDRCKGKRNGQWPQITRSYIHSTPKPCVWQGEHRLTQQDWFAAANARNTGLCLCDTKWIAYVDDLSVLMPGWLERVQKAMEENYIVFGAYKKVWNLVIEKGEAKTWEERPLGIDSRLSEAKEDCQTVAGSWLFGCSLAGPTEAFLLVNGWPEWADGMSLEDCLMGTMIGNTNQYSFRYDKKMLTVESAEDHFVEPSLRRADKGVSPRDKSHRAVDIAMQSTRSPNYFDETGIRGLRERVLAGDPFPIMKIPQHDWYDGQPIADML